MLTLLPVVLVLLTNWSDNVRFEGSMIQLLLLKFVFNFSVPFEDNVLIVTDWTHNKIYFVSLVSNDTRAFDIETGGNPNAVVYNPVEKTVIWADTKDSMIHSAFLNGSNHKIIINEGKNILHVHLTLFILYLTVTSMHIQNK